jgi:hypothetical protein
MSLNAHRALVALTMIITIIGLRPYWYGFESTTAYTATYAIGGLGLCATISLSPRWRSIVSFWTGITLFIATIAVCLPWLSEIRGNEPHFAFGISWIGAALAIGMITAGSAELEEQLRYRRVAGKSGN